MKRQISARDLVGPLLASLLFLGAQLMGGCSADDPEGGAAGETAPDLSGESTNPSQTPLAEAAESQAKADSADEALSRFAPGGAISDADLANYHVEMACEVDGKDVGTMTFALWTEAAPITTRNFLRLSDEGFYDGIAFHRILRSFMIQGGDPTGTGAGNSPHGTIQAEFSDAPERRHGYGVLSMARLGNNPDSASCQFFLCCDESGSVWGLDNNYSSFGKLTSGVATLEAIASVPTTASPQGEPSKPTLVAKITKATVKKGPAPTGEIIERPMPPLDLGGQPERVVAQHVLISFAGRSVEGVTRTQEEAEALAQTILERAQAGESMDDLVREFSDDLLVEGDPTPGYYSILNTGVRDLAAERKMFNIQNEFGTAIEKLQAEVRAGTLTQADYQSRGQALQAEAQRKAMDSRIAPRSGLVPSFGDVAFGLEVGEVGMASFDEAKSPFGYHIIKRVK